MARAHTIDAVAEAAATAHERPVEHLLAVLGELRGLRHELDQHERVLIAAARTRRQSWSTIATALQLESRQAAEQRYLRLSGGGSRDPRPVRADRRRHQTVDANYGPAIAQLRRAAVDAARALSTLDRLTGVLALARDSLEMATSAPPGALYTLAVKAIHDLAGVAAGTLPAPVARAAGRLRLAVDAAAAPAQTP